jgi:hypothetical protein
VLAPCCGGREHAPFVQQVVNLWSRHPLRLAAAAVSSSGRTPSRGKSPAWT